MRCLLWLSQKTQATPLCVACLMKEVAPVKSLLDKGASPNGAEEVRSYVCMYMCFNDEGETDTLLTTVAALFVFGSRTLILIA